MKLKFLSFRHKALQAVAGNESEGFSFRKYSWKQFKKNRAAFWSLIILILWVVLAALAPILANEKPLHCNYKGEDLYPAFSFKNEYVIGNKKINLENFDWKTAEYEHVTWAWCAYSPGKSDAFNLSVSPLGEQHFMKSNGELIISPNKFRHRFGTAKDGSDVLAGLIHGIKYSLFIGILSMLLASIIGIVLGAVAGFYGNSGLQAKRGVIILACTGAFFGWFYGFSVRHYNISDAFAEGGLHVLFQLLLSLMIFSLCIYLFVMLGKLISKGKFLSKEINLPVDGIVSRLIEIINSLPLFLVILAIAAISRPSFATLVLIIAFTNWTGIARFTRAEFLKVSKLEYIQAAQALGLSNRRIIFKHALPNAIGPAFIAIAFGIAGAILTESALSFIGVGVPPETITWGKLLGAARESSSSWWLIIFPGLAIFITVTMYNLIGEGLRDAMDPKLKK